MSQHHRSRSWDILSTVKHSAIYSSTTLFVNNRHKAKPSRTTGVRVNTFKMRPVSGNKRPTCCWGASGHTGTVPRGITMNNTTQETNSQVVRAVGCHYSSHWQAIYNKGHPVQGSSHTHAHIHTKTQTQANRQEPIVHVAHTL